ncbi:PAS domain S-box protein [Mucilaginibacter gotjawali]|uniref:histidine kinase n=2 Tax=Mucilaginibacter gotjawali TaxID=1550579 RepID=A0A0X8X485_9SPHI|nr:PAS domain S-box protein [Mucilaginibacter gotjawali]MBB3057673.1 PAS domain S-box-containing protein [Mucilaginibacter gotjawali]BAU55336.1 sensory histidine kinase AtoS [Mucilaginibacter gotjawali]
MINNESERIEEVHKYLKLDLNKSKELQDIVDLASEICDKPIALITLLDEDVNWLKVRSGGDIEVAPRDTSFCQFSIQQDDVMVVGDALNDKRFDDNPMVHSDPHIRFYAGAPLVLNNGFKLGTLCLFDFKPNSLNSLQQKALTVLSRQAAFLMELELSKQQLKQQIAETEVKNEALIRIAYMQSHDVRQPLTIIMGLVSLIQENLHAVDTEWLEMMTASTNNLDGKIKAIVKESMSDKDLKLIRFNRMIEEIEDYAILMLDENGYIENWNKGAELLKGYIATEAIGQNFKIFYTQEDRSNSKPEKLIAEAAEFGVAKDEGWRVRKNGTMFWGKIVITAIHNEKNEVIGFTKVTRDLSPQMAPVRVA